MTTMTTPSDAPAAANSKRFPTGSLIGGILLCLLAVASLVGGGLLLWKDTIDRDADGFVPIGTNELNADTPAILGELEGDGPDWLWGSDVMGDGRIRASSQTGEPLFVGIAPTEDVERYLDGAGYTTIEHFTTSASTTHQGRASVSPPSRESIWTESTEGTGEQTIVWTPRDGDWSVVFMNADGSGPVAVDGELSAELPSVKWLEAALLVSAAVFALLGCGLLVRVRRRSKSSSTTQTRDPRTPGPARAPGVPS
jgi:hypothetical protein